MFGWFKVLMGGQRPSRSLEGYQWSDAHASPPKEKWPEKPLPVLRTELAPDLVEGPWLRGGLPACPQADPLRTEILRSLYDEQARQETPEDAAFIGRLIRVVGTAKLEFPPFPDIARQLDGLLKERDPSMFQVVALVEQDPSLVRRVWVAGSGAAYLHPPSGLHHAIARIGFDALWRIGMAVCLNSQVFRVRGYQAAADAVRTHGILVGELAAWLRDERRGQHYLSGLLHDVGKLVVYRAASVRDGFTSPSEALVQMIVDRHHPSLSLLAAHAWSLGDDVAQAVGYHHHPVSAPDQVSELSRILWAADIAAHTAQEALAGRDCGGDLELERMVGLPKTPQALLKKAHSLVKELNQQCEEEAAATDLQAG